MIKKILEKWQLILLILFSLTPVLWFLGRRGVLINGVDTNFPLDPAVWFGRRFFVWNDVASAGTNFASSTAGLFFHLIQIIPYYLGANLQLVQIISLIFWFALVVFAAYFFARNIFPERKVAQIVFVTLYTFNTYLFNTWENVKVANLAAVISLPLLLTIHFLKENKKISYPQLFFFTALTGVLASGAGINPAYFLVILGALVLWGLITGGKKTLLIMLSVFFLINSFWIVSTGRQLFFSDRKVTELSDIGFTNWLDSLSENTSLVNVLRLQGAWDWYAKDDAGAPLYIPYANNFFRRLPFVGFSFLLTALALGGLLVKDPTRKKMVVYFSLMLTLGVFLGAGSHEPTGFFYKLLSRYFPPFSFFRSPWYLFTPFTTLALAWLVGFLFYGRWKFQSIAAAVLIAGNLIYTYPMVTGKIFRPDIRGGFYVRFPDYVFEAKDWLLKSASDGRIAGFPGDDIERFEWGYSGIESILNLFSKRETIFANLNATDSPSAKAIGVFYSAMRRGQTASAQALAAKLNISTIFEKGDQDSLWGPLPDEVKNFEKTGFGPWTFYELTGEKFLPKIYLPEKLFFGLPREELEKSVGFLGAREALLDPGDSVINSVPKVSELTGKISLAANSQVTDYEDYVASYFRQNLAFEEKNPFQVKYTVELVDGGFYRPVLEDFNFEDFGVYPEKGLGVQLDGQDQIWQGEKSGDLFSFDAIYLNSGEHEVVISLLNKNLITNGEPVFGLTNRGAEEKYVLFTINPFESQNLYLIEFDYKNIYGQKSIFKVEQKSANVNYKFQNERPPFSPEWVSYSFYFEPIPAESFLEIKPTALPIFDDALGTKIEYRNISIYPVFTNKLAFVKQPEGNLARPAQIAFEKISPVEYKGTVRGSQGAEMIIFSENYSSDWEITLRTTEGKKIDYQPLHFSSNLYANTWFVEGIKGDYDFEIYYQPQKMHNIFLLVSIGTLLSATGMYLLSRRRR